MNGGETSAWLLLVLLQGALVLALATGLAMAFRDGPARYVIWRAGVALLLLLTGLAAWGPVWISIELLPRAAAPTAQATAAEEIPISEMPPVIQEAPVRTQWTADLVKSGRLLPPLVYLTWVWLAGVALGLVRLAMVWVRAGRMYRCARLRRLPEGDVYESPSIFSPVTVGIRRPRILVPVGFADWASEDRSMVLRHEHCHIRSRDGAWQLAGNLMAILHWPNPLAWLVLRWMGWDRELHADASVLGSGVSPQRYCDLLIRIASGTRTSLVLPMARRSSVPRRIDAILDARQSGKVERGPLLWLAVGMLGGICLTVGVTRLVRPELQGNVQPELLTQVFHVPPGWPPEPNSARQALENIGVTFPNDASAILNPMASQLIVRNTHANLNLVEGYLDSLKEEVAKQIFLSAKVVTLPDARLLLEALAKATGLPEGPKEYRVPDRPGRVYIAGILEDSQLSVLLRALNADKGTELRTLDSCVTHSGARSQMEHDGKTIFDVTATIGSDGYTIDLFPEMRISDGGIATFEITLWDGQTVLWAERLRDDSLRATLFTARLIETAAKPVH